MTPDVGHTLDLLPPSQLCDRLQSRIGQLDGAYRASMVEAVDHLRRTGLAQRARHTGDRAPDFALKNDDNKPIVLSSLLMRGPVVLSFFRGEWCSFCRIEMEALFGAQAAIAAAGASLVFVSPQAPTAALLKRGRERLHVTVLHDAFNGVGLQYGLVFRMPDVLRQAMTALGVDVQSLYGSESWLLPIPATYVIGSDGIIALAHTDPDFTNRLDPDVILTCLSNLGRETAAESFGLSDQHGQGR